MEEDDQTLVQRARRGDRTAFDSLCRRHEEAIRAHLYGRLPSRLRKRLSVGDVVQEVLTTALQKLRAMEEPLSGSVRGWLLKIAEYKAKEAARFHLDTAKRAAGAEMSSPHRPVTEALRVAPMSPSRHAIALESSDELDAHLAGLPDHYRLIIELVYERGLPIPEAARRLGQSPDATRKLHARAIAALARGMQASGEGSDGSA